MNYIKSFIRSILMLFPRQILLSWDSNCYHCSCRVLRNIIVVNKTSNARVINKGGNVFPGYIGILYAAKNRPDLPPKSTAESTS